MRDTPLKELEPRALRGHTRFAITTFYAGVAINAFFSTPEAPAIYSALASWLCGSAAVMWCFIDSMRSRVAFPYGLWWTAVVPLYAIATPVYVLQARGWAGLRKLLMHALFALLLSIGAFALSALWS